jgi:hypothetical protein
MYVVLAVLKFCQCWPLIALFCFNYLGLLLCCLSFLLCEAARFSVFRSRKRKDLIEPLNVVLHGKIFLWSVKRMREICFLEHFLDHGTLFFHLFTFLRRVERVGQCKGLKRLHFNAQIDVKMRNRNLMCVPCKYECPFCGHQWIRRKLYPLRCPSCKRKLSRRS